MDVRTMAVMVALANVLLAAVLVAQYRYNRRYAGFGWWAAGQTMIAMGFVVSNLRGATVGGLIAIPVWHVCLVLGFTLVYIGVLRFLGRRERRGPLIVLVIVVGAWSSYFTFDDNRMSARGVGIYAALSVVLAALAYALTRFRPPTVRRSALFLSAVFGVAAGAYAVIAVAQAFRFAVADPVFEPSAVNTAIYLSTSAATILWVFGLVFLVNERLQADVAQEADNMHRTFTTSPDCAIISRLVDGVITDVNEGFTRITGFTPDEAVGRSTRDLKLWQDVADRVTATDPLICSGECENVPAVLRRKDGSTIDCLIAARRLILDGEPHLISLTRDVTQQRRLEEQLLYQATTDSLTRVANRRHFLAEVDHAFSRSLRHRVSLCIAVIDIDGFKAINDAMGHAAGDLAITHFAKVIQGEIRDIDLLGRLGGDEFALLMPDTELQQALVAVERLRCTMAKRPVAVEGALVTIAFSAGIASIERNADSVEAVLARADAALYEAKETGRDQVMPSTAH